MTREELLKAVTDHYLAGRDNGYPVPAIEGLEREELESLLVSLVQDELVSLNFGTYHRNPYIKAMPPEPIDDQLRKLRQIDDLTHLTIYPEPKHLEAAVDPAVCVGRP